MNEEEIKEVQTADRILEIVLEALKMGQFNYHVAKLKNKNGETGEDVIETKLKALDTKRILEVVTALEKIVNVKRKVSDESVQSENQEAGKIILPDIEYPQDCGGDEI
ncbi:MAG: hypothetical protein Q8873_03015 [Bacillota bacterium]|nr:hypothetical protein [Bacillota bacterium]